MTEMKVCSKCKLEKPLGEFYKHCGHKDGLRSDCKSCKTLKSERVKKPKLEDLVDELKLLLIEDMKQRFNNDAAAIKLFRLDDPSKVKFTKELLKDKAKELKLL